MIIIYNIKAKHNGTLGNENGTKLKTKPKIQNSSPYQVFIPHAGVSFVGHKELHLASKCCIQIMQLVEPQATKIETKPDIMCLTK